LSVPVHVLPPTEGRTRHLGRSRAQSQCMYRTVKRNHGQRANKPTKLGATAEQQRPQLKLIRRAKTHKASNTKSSPPYHRLTGKQAMAHTETDDEARQMSNAAQHSE